MTLASGITLAEGGYYAFVAGSNNTGSNGTIFLTTSSSQYLLDIEAYSGGGIYNLLDDNSAPGVTGLGGSLLNNSPHVFGFTVGPTSSLIHLDGSSFSKTNIAGITLTSLTSFSGANYALHGRIFEIIVGNDALSSGQITSVLGYLKTKWDTP